MFALFIAAWIKRSEDDLTESLKRYPALFAGLVSITCQSLSLHFSFLALLILLSLLSLIFFSSYKKGLLFLSFALFFFLIGSARAPPSFESPEYQQGQGTLILNKIKVSASFFKEGYTLEGTLEDFVLENGKILTRFPCLLFLDVLPQEISSQYFVQAKIKTTPSGKALVKPFQLEKKGKGLCTPKLRFELQERFSSFICQKIPEEKVADLLIALFCGRIEDPLLSLEFSKLGLSHLLAISGFHFGLLATFFGGILQRLFPKKWAAAILIFLLCSYTAFLGLSPSVLRATLMAIGTQLCLIFSCKSLPLNNLGVSLLGTCLLLPQEILSPAMILSFSCTFSLLFFSPLLVELFSKGFPERKGIWKAEAPFFAKCLFFLSSFLKHSLAINVTIALWSFPITLYFFHTFPLFSLFYNLFIPALIALLLPVFVFALLLYCVIPPLALLLFSCVNIGLHLLLTILHQPPPFLDYKVNLMLGKEVPIFSCIALFLLGIYLYKKKSPSSLFPSCVF